MPNPAADEARTLNDRQLADAINQSYRELFNLQFQRGTRQLQNPTALRGARRQIARLRTIQQERHRAELAGAPLEPLTAAPEAEISPQRQAAAAEAATDEIDDAEVDAAEDADQDAAEDAAEIAVEPSDEGEADASDDEEAS